MGSCNKARYFVCNSLMKNLKNMLKNDLLAMLNPRRVNINPISPTANTKISNATSTKAQSDGLEGSTGGDFNIIDKINF